MTFPAGNDRRSTISIVGIVGGVASGKSVVARQLVELGAGLLDADRAGHEALRLPEVEAAIARQWGDAVFGPDGRVDRSRLAAIVFGPEPEGPRQRRWLEGLTHPRIRQILQEKCRDMAEAGVPVAVLDAPLLLEAGWSAVCDHLLFVDVPRQTRLARARSRGWTDQQFAAREAAQLPVEQKRRQARIVIDNSGSEAATRAQVEAWWRTLLADRTAAAAAQPATE